ncbi:hypothetical protein G7A66_11720 [Altererythrobacter sp. SALINAS58]|uniref:hypothetical protein n=1 Tax=Alteripontixanthobacter muriae TaxID=2705546 RepID=UPI0015754830|nr:hypothetical protein [Alteripontixanthobacter muriae]NTZ43739.1 hypothetical protein [Alteripontixanthobacter muriae]
MRAILFLLPMLAGACSAGSPNQSQRDVPADALATPAEQEQSGSADELLAPASLVSEYRVAGVDGEPLNAEFGIALSVGADTISFDNCQQIAWNYAYDKGELTTSRASAGTAEPPSASPQGLPCAAALPPAKQAMVEALDAATRARRTQANGIVISGEGRSLTLFSQ